MKWYIKQSNADGDELFVIYNDVGQPAFYVRNEKTPLYNRMVMQNVAKMTVAKINRIGVHTLSRYDIIIDGRDNVRVVQNLTASAPKFTIRGANWHFRGDLISRSFDILDVDNSILMTHGHCWGVKGECFAAEINGVQNDLTCLCIAIVIDSIVMGGLTAALPVGN